MTGSELETLVNAWRRIRDTGSGLAEVEPLLRDPAACVRATTAFLLSRVRDRPGVQDVLARAARQSPDSVVRYFAESPGGYP